jgi:hypothetical protein
VRGICSIEGCNRPHSARGLCKAHWKRWKKYGDPLVTRRPGLGLTSEQRFWRMVEVSEDHWLWLGYISEGGYGQFGNGDRIVKAHRFAYELLAGPIPQGLEPDHLCRVRSCVKAVADEFGPAHLELVTHRENVLRGNGWAGQHARQTECIHGHPFDEKNTYWNPALKGRQCRACDRARNVGRQR